MACWCKGKCPLIRGINQKIARRQYPQAEHDLKIALADSPSCVEANMALGEIFTNTNRASDAMVHFARATKTAGEVTPAAAFKIGMALRNQTRLHDAILSFETAMYGDPENPLPVAALIETRVAAGVHVGDAYARTMLDIFPASPEIHNAVAEVAGAEKNWDAAIRHLEFSGARPVDIFNRGRYKDRKGDHDGAWLDWQAARQKLHAGGLAFNKAEFDRTIGDLKSFAQRSRLKKLPAPLFPDHSWTPIFITGFPRSGTTVFEAALASHPSVAAGDELPFIHEIIRIAPALLNTDLTYPAVLGAGNYGDVAPAVWDTLRNWYLARADGRLPTDPGKTRFTDKMCVNEIHIPLIRSLFPRAPIFRLHRHPLDVIVSNFSYNFNIAWHCSATLKSIAYAYREIDSLVQLYKKLLPATFHEIRYENFVGNMPDTMMLAQKAAKLSPDDSYKEFHASDRFARTASHRQIKEPLYDRSIGRWKNYRKFLAPVIEELRPIIEREAYEL